jgi:hypothetical protein
MSLSKIKVLLLNVNREGWHSGNMIYDMLSVQKACDTKIYGPGWPGYKTTDMVKIIEQLYGNDKPDVIYSYFTPNEKVQKVYMRHYKIPDELRYFPTNFDSVKGVVKIFALSDFWSRNPGTYTKDLKDSSFEYCFCCFAPPYSNPDIFFSFFNDDIRKQIKFIGHPRCVDIDCYKDYRLEKKYDVVTVGAMQSFYPLRVHMHKYLSKNSQIEGINYKNYPHCGVNFKHSNFVRQDYARAINEGKMLLSCGGRYNLAMNKTFEAMGCRTAYVGGSPWGESELHLKDGFNYVSVNKTNYVEKIKYYLDNPQLLDEISTNGMNTFMKYHHIEARSADLVKRLEAIL